MVEETLLPLFLRVRDRPCLLVGAGSEASRKGLALLAAGARLTILADSLEGELAAAVAAGLAFWSRGPFVPAHLDGMWLAVSASDDMALNAALHAAALERRVWLNVVDQPRFCTLIWPAVVVRPPVTLAITTGGAAPALAGYLRRRIEAWLPEGVGALARRLSVWRREVPGGLAARGRFWRELLDQGVAERFLQGDEAGAEEMVRQALASCAGSGASLGTGKAADRERAENG
ncbi:MAG: bifunctional precorrin-2 dehydrogenase/sirohydrochlorin ferrochelatase [Magnetococcales bacterium]|nr:bifunctional precorrin-2 dehydrogenase/sirohydrochlorin ferrochelatase [Magnetococcales bacterium]